MNSLILKKEVQQFIVEHLQTDITKLILKGSPFKGISIQELANQIIAKAKSEKKLPTWFNNENIYYPNKLSIEQTSSEIAAAYKSTLVSGTTLVDITGGFGVDSYYFSKVFKKVVHCEIDEELSTIVAHNYQQLNIENIDTKATNGFDFLKKTDALFDCIYIDPSRRNDTKQKVFLLKDCLPNIPPKIDFFFTKSNLILIKVSPILDITSSIKELKNVKNIHVIAIQNEVKELLFLLEKDYEKEITITTINVQKEKNQSFSFVFQEQETTKFDLPQHFLYEPNAAILKSGGFKNITSKYAVSKLHENSHLFTSENLVDFPGRRFKILDVLSYDKKQIKKKLSNNKANITIRNFPKTVAQIRKETKINDGGNCYLFFTTDVNNDLRVIICDKC